MSVVIPVYNNAKELLRTLCGLGLQENLPPCFEVIISDDGSGDEIEESIFSEEFRFPIIYRRQARRGFRLATARNRGIRLASYDVILLLDSDIYPNRDLVVRHFARHQSTPNAVVAGIRRFVDLSNISTDQIRLNTRLVHALSPVKSSSNWFRETDRRIPEFAKLRDHPAPYNILHGCNLSFRRQPLVTIGLFDEDFNLHWGYEDIEFGYRLWKGGCSIIADADIVGFHQENQTTGFDQRAKDDLINFELACRKIPNFLQFKTRLNACNRIPWW